MRENRGWIAWAFLLAMVALIAYPLFLPSGEQDASKDRGSERRPETTAEPTTPEPKPEPPSLYEQAVTTPSPPYEVVVTVSQTRNRYDVYVATARTQDRARLGAILVELGEREGSDLVTAYFCSEPGEQACINTLFATGELAQTDRGREFMAAGEGAVPYMRVHF